MKLIETSKKTT